MTESNSPLDVQVGGNHYKGFKIQPVEFIETNRLGFLPGCMIKRLCRFDQPSGKGFEDLRKVVHEIDLFVEIHDLPISALSYSDQFDDNQAFRFERFAGDVIRADDPAIHLESFLAENRFADTIRGSIITYVYYAVRAFQADQYPNAAALMLTAQQCILLLLMGGENQ